MIKTILSAASWPYEECSDPDFGEASCDYAHAALALPSEKASGEGE